MDTKSRQIYTFQSKTGKEIALRYPTIEDLDSVWKYINTISAERTFISFQGEQLTIEEEKAYLEKQIDAIAKQKAIMLLAFHNETLIGITGIDMQARIEHHIGLFGISLAKEFRGEGIGRTLMNTVIDEAKNNIPELEILTLTVFSSNGKACSLYESLGFTQYGILPNGVKLEDGYVDHVYMYKRVR